MKRNLSSRIKHPETKALRPLTREIGSTRQNTLLALGLVAMVAGSMVALQPNTVKGSTGTASKEIGKGHLDGVIVGNILLTAGNNSRTSMSTAPDINTPTNSKTGTDNIYHKILPGQVLKSDYALQVTDENNNVWLAMPTTEGFVYDEVSSLDSNAINNVTVNGKSALSFSPNHDLSLSFNSQGVPQLVDSLGHAQNIAAAAILDASKA
jgi:hypothetical protein